MRRAPLPEPDRAQVARGPSGKVRLAQSPAGRDTPRLSLGHRGAQPSRAPSAQPHQSSTGRDEKKQQPPHRSGRTRGKLELPRFPQLRTAGNGNDATRGSLPASTATRKSGREAAGTPSLGHCPPPPRPAPPTTPIGPRSTNCEHQKEVALSCWRACSGSRNAQRFPWQRLPGCTPSAKGWSFRSAAVDLFLALYLRSFALIETVYCS